MASIAVDTSDEEVTVGIECEISWFKLLIGDLELTVSFEQLEGIYDAVRPFFVDDPNAESQDLTP